MDLDEALSAAASDATEITILGGYYDRLWLLDLLRKLPRSRRRDCRVRIAVGSDATITLPKVWEHMREVQKELRRIGYRLIEIAIVGRSPVHFHTKLFRFLRTTHPYWFIGSARLLDPARFACCFGQFLDRLGEAGTGVLAINGKTLRRSFDTAAGQSPLQVVTAFACERRMVLAQAAMRTKENEILAARDVLNMLDIKGMLVTADALHCNATTTALIVERGADYLIGLKAGHAARCKAVFAVPPKPPDEHVTTDAGYSRIETRRHQVWHDIDWLISARREADTAPLVGHAMVGMIQTTVEYRDRTRCEQRFYASSRPLSAAQFAQAARAHWQIENSLHWVLDTCFDEDRARNRRDHGPENLTTLRKIAPNVLRSARPDISIRRKRKRSGWTDEFARSVFGQMR